MVGAQVKPATERKREVGTICGNAEARKHPADRHGAEVCKQIDQEIPVHRMPLTSLRVVPANAGTHTPCGLVWAGWSTPSLKATMVITGPGERRDDAWSGLRRKNQPSTFAAVSCTDSPQPQAPVWFGLLKMNCADILSAL